MEQSDEQELNLAEIARGRRITASCAREIDMVPRKSERPKRSAAQKMIRKVSAKLKTALSSSEETT